jgi:hypothetical protein
MPLSSPDQVHELPELESGNPTLLLSLPHSDLLSTSFRSDLLKCPIPDKSMVTTSPHFSNQGITQGYN